MTNSNKLFINIYNRYDSKDEGSANGHEVPARQTPKYIDNITFKTDKIQETQQQKILLTVLQLGQIVFHVRGRSGSKSLSSLS